MRDHRSRKTKVHSHAVCAECGNPSLEYECDGEPGSLTVDAWARKHAKETGHIVTIEESHDVVHFNA